MTATITPCSTAILAEKSIGLLQILHKHRGFTNAFARKFYEKMVAFIQSRNLEIY